MGKFLLLAVLSASVVLGQQIYASQQTESKTGKDQRAYQEEVIAREIATSAFNYGMAELRSHGENIQDGARDLNGADGTGQIQVHTTGKFAGGRHTVKAMLTSGHSVKVFATGEYGAYTDEDGETQYRASINLHDEYRVPVMNARHRGVVDVNFIESQAGYCSAVFYQAFTSEMPDGYVPEIKLLFAADNREGLVNRPSQQIVVDPGTQMNFFIGVDKNCSMRIDETNYCEARKSIKNYTFKAADFDHVHYALDVEAGELDKAEEAIWAFVEQSASDRNRWRIGWEDLHRTDWDNPDSETPSNSLQATKAYGYDVTTGWLLDGDYRLLDDFSSRPDFSDQVIEISVVPVNSPAGLAKLAEEEAAKATCGETPVVDPTPDPDPDPTPDPDPDPAPDPVDDPDDVEREADGEDCTCQGIKKVCVFHRPPGNEHNPQRICIGKPAWENAHSQQHNDYVICTGLDKKLSK